MTIYDIAREAGVSGSTVSRVINDRPGVNAATRQKIEQLLKKHNYSPNETARGLVNRSSKTIGVLVADIRTIHHADGAYYIEKELAARGYCCFIFNTGTEDATKAEAIRTLAQRRVEGVVLIGSTFQCDAVRKAVEQHLPDVPVVLVNGLFDLPNTYSVMCDELHGVEKCVYKLANESHEKLAYIYDVVTPSNSLKEEGFRNAMREIGRGDAIWCYKANADWMTGYDCTLRVLDEHPEVNGLIYSVDLLAVSGLHALRDRHIAVPDRIAVMGIDNSIYGLLCTPKLTSLDNKLFDSSVAAAHVLIACLENGTPPRQQVLYSTIVRREST